MCSIRSYSSLKERGWSTRWGRAEAGLAYVHVASTEYLTHLHVGGRSAEDIDAGGILDGYHGILVRDGYAGYQHLAEADHAWCGAHLLRDLRAIHDAQLWAAVLATTLADANTAAVTAAPPGIPAWMRRPSPGSAAPTEPRSPKDSPTTPVTAAWPPTPHAWPADSATTKT